MFQARSRRKLHIDFGVKGTSGRCALAPGVPRRSAITAQRGGDPEIIDDNIAQTVCRSRRLGIAANDVFEVGQRWETLTGTERPQPCA